MPLYYLLLLAIVQGLTEFLPVSSSAHLEIAHKLSIDGKDDLALDIAVHLGTLGAVILYFWADVKTAFWGFFELLRGKTQTAGARLALGLIIATIPVVLVGLLIVVFDLQDWLRSLTIMGWAMIIFGILLWYFDRAPTQVKTMPDWTLRDAIKMGLWQMVALIPGASRSGMTITGALAMGYTRRDGAKIAMLMSIPTILASGAILLLDVAKDANMALLKDGAIAAFFAFLAALLALKFMMKLLETVSFTPYVIYRIVVGVILLGFAYT